MPSVRRQSVHASYRALESQMMRSWLAESMRRDIYDFSSRVQEQRMRSWFDTYYTVVSNVRQGLQLTFAVEGATPLEQVKIAINAWKSRQAEIAAALDEDWMTKIVNLLGKLSDATPELPVALDIYCLLYPDSVLGTWAGRYESFNDNLDLIAAWMWLFNESRTGRIRKLREAEMDAIVYGDYTPKYAWGDVVQREFTQNIVPRIQTIAENMPCTSLTGPPDCLIRSVGFRSTRVIRSMDMDAIRDGAMDTLSSIRGIMEKLND